MQEKERAELRAKTVPIIDDVNSPDLPVLEGWSVRGNNRYSGVVHINGKRLGEHRELCKGARLSFDKKTIEIPKIYGQKIYRLGEPKQDPVQE